MKAVVYHADAENSHYKKGYEPLFKGMLENFHAFNIKVIHLTLEGFPGWGDENVFYKGFTPRNIIYNREICFTRFLETAPDDIYWFTEPDSRIREDFPPLKADLALCKRPLDTVKICPAWRLCTPKALPFFKEIARLMENCEKEWNGDSTAFQKVNLKQYNIELRDYAEYVSRGGRYSRNYKGEDKSCLLKS